MSYVNGAVTHGHAMQSSAVPPNLEMETRGGFTPERVAGIRERLSEPFDPAEIKWRVTATSTQQSRHGPVKRGQLVAYADQRAYTDRLNDVFGEWGWTREYIVQVAQNFERPTARENKQSIVAAKVVVVSTVVVHGLGSHTGMGEEWADDENAATRAEAQAFKRACACFGLGRYLYDLDKVWEDLDQYNRPVRTPSLPEWARPRSPNQHTASKGPGARQGLVQQETLAQVQQLCDQVGFGLSKFTLHKYAGVTDPSKAGYAKLTTVLERLADIAKGIERLRAATSVIRDAEYAAICGEVNLPSDSIDDIPNRETLRVLLERVEAAANRNK
ncbi:MAG: hypothetical protein IPJ98_00495 [Bryobacterales bacterium]|nr:hypothetical protein [Bryobacterales bacterium]